MSDTKKDVPFTIRVPKELKDRFIEVAKQNDTSASKELRDFMRKYVVSTKGQRNLL